MSQLNIKKSRQKTDGGLASTRNSRTSVASSISEAESPRNGGGSRYMHPAIRKLKDQQVGYAAQKVRLAQLERIEDFLQEVQADREYSYQEIFYKVTKFRSREYPDLKISGHDVQHDLRCFIEDLSDSVDLIAEEFPEVLTVQEVSNEFNVSTKTVDRWRSKGLASRRFLFGNRKRVGFLRSTIEMFLKTHSAEVDRGRRFSQVSGEQREEILRRARRMAITGASLTEISKRLAEKMGRSIETIRTTIKKYDQDYPENAIFPSMSAPLSEEARQEIVRRYHGGTSVDRLAKEFRRKRSSVYRVVTEGRYEALLAMNLDFIDSEEFHQTNAEKLILSPMVQQPKASPKVKAPPGLPAYLTSLYKVPLLSREQEGYYFRKMNFLKFKAVGLRDSLKENMPSNAVMDKIDLLIEQINDVKNFLIRSNLRLVVSIAKKHMNPQANFFEMVSDGNMSLIKAIEKFDYSKGFKFSTYATWAIMKNFARSIPAELTRADRFRTASEEVFLFSPETRSSPLSEEIVNQQQRDAIMTILKQLDEREQRIIMRRYGLKKGDEPLTLEQVGQELGVTKERIRQLESRALRKLRKFATEKHLDIPGI